MFQKKASHVDSSTQDMPFVGQKCESGKNYGWNKDLMIEAYGQQAALHVQHTMVNFDWGLKRVPPPHANSSPEPAMCCVGFVVLEL
eukprot:955713-Amphidinium_carterae.1